MLQWQIRSVVPPTRENRQSPLRFSIRQSTTQATYCYSSRFLAVSENGPHEEESRRKVKL